MGRRFLILMGLVCLCLSALVGCGASHPYFQGFRVKPPVQACSVAVLPLINRSGYSQGEGLLYRVLLAQVVNHRPWRVALEGDVRKMYRELRLMSWSRPTPEQLQVIASRLDVDILIGGEILDMEEQKEGRGVNPRLRLQLQVYDGRDGSLLWATYHSRQGTDYRKVLHFGLSNSVSQLGNKMIKEILTLWEEEGLVACVD